MDIKQPKRPRGRPKGSGLNDLPKLARIADLLVLHPQLKPTTAMKRLGATDETTIRRLQVKWKAGAEAYMTAARRRVIDAAKLVADRSAGRCGLLHRPLGGAAGQHSPFRPDDLQMLEFQLEELRQQQLTDGDAGSFADWAERMRDLDELRSIADLLARERQAWTDRMMDLQAAPRAVLDLAMVELATGTPGWLQRRADQLKCSLLATFALYREGREQRRREELEGMLQLVWDAVLATDQDRWRTGLPLSASHLW